MVMNINEINMNESLAIVASLKAELGSNIRVGIGLLVSKKERRLCTPWTKKGGHTNLQTDDKTLLH